MKDKVIKYGFYYIPSSFVEIDNSYTKTNLAQNSTRLSHNQFNVNRHLLAIVGVMNTTIIFIKEIAIFVGI